MDIKQRVEIISSDLDVLKRSGGATDSYTKTEADNKFAEKTNVYTKAEADSAIETGAAVATNLFTTTTSVPGSGSEPVASDLPWSHAVARNDFTMNINSYSIRFSFIQTTQTDNVFYRGIYIDPSTSQIRMIIVEVGPAVGADPTSTITLIAYTTL